MAKTFTEDQLQARYDILPQILQDALFDPDVSEKIYDLCQKYGILGERIPIAAAEIGNIILGLTPPNDFVPRIVEILSIKENTAQAFAKEIFVAVLQPIENDIKRAHGFELARETAEPYAARAPLGPRAQEPESIKSTPPTKEVPAHSLLVKPTTPPQEFPRARATPQARPEPIGSQTLRVERHVEGPIPQAPLPAPLPPRPELVEGPPPPPPAIQEVPRPTPPIRETPRPAPPPMRETLPQAPEPLIKPSSEGISGQAKSIEEKKIIFTVPKRPPEPPKPPTQTTPLEDLSRPSTPPTPTSPRAPEPMPKNVIMPDRPQPPPAKQTIPPAPKPPAPQKIFIPQKPLRDQSGGDVYREPIAPEEKIIRRESPPPYKPEPIYTNPKIPPINLRPNPPPTPPEQKPKTNPDPYREEFK